MDREVPLDDGFDSQLPFQYSTWPTLWYKNSRQPHMNMDTERWMDDSDFYLHQNASDLIFEGMQQPSWGDERSSNASQRDSKIGLKPSYDSPSTHSSLFSRFQNRQSLNGAFGYNISSTHKMLQSQSQNSTTQSGYLADASSEHPNSAYSQFVQSYTSGNLEQPVMRSVQGPPTQSRVEMAQGSHGAQSSVTQPTQLLVTIHPSAPITATVHYPINGDMRFFRCIVPTCHGMSFTRWADFQRHYVVKHAANKPKFYCTVPGCHRRDAFSRKDKMEDHAKTKHL